MRSAIVTAAGPSPGTNHEAEYRFKHADGSWVWLASVASTRTESTGFVVNSREITELGAVREAIEAEHERYEAVVEGINDAIIIVNPAREISSRTDEHTRSSD